MFKIGDEVKIKFNELNGKYDNRDIIYFAEENNNVHVITDINCGDEYILDYNYYYYFEECLLENNY